MLLTIYMYRGHLKSFMHAEKKFLRPSFKSFRCLLETVGFATSRSRETPWGTLILLKRVPLIN